MNNLTLPKSITLKGVKSGSKQPVIEPKTTIFESLEYCAWIDTARDEFDNKYEEYEDVPYITFVEETGDAEVSTDDGVVVVPNAVVSWVDFQKKRKK